MFIFDCECHMLPSTEDIRHFPLYKMNHQAVVNLVRRLEPSSVFGIKEIRSFEETRASRKRRLGKAPGESADALIEKMDECGVTMACVLPESMLPHVILHANGIHQRVAGKRIGQIPRPSHRCV